MNSVMYSYTIKDGWLPLYDGKARGRGLPSNTHDLIEAGYMINSKIERVTFNTTVFEKKDPQDQDTPFVVITGTRSRSYVVLLDDFPSLVSLLNGLILDDF